MDRRRRPPGAGRLTVQPYGARLAAWARRAGARAADVVYPRAEARGDACALRLLPSGAARARVVVAHGAGNDAVFPLLELFRALLDAGCEVFTFDVDGHGWGSTTVFAADTVRGAVPAAVAEAERGGTRLPLHLVGHSLGGSLVLDALASGTVPRALSASILSSPTDLRLGARTVVGEVRGFFRRATLAQRAHYGWWGLVPAFGPVKRAAYPFRRVDEDGRAWSYVAAVRSLLAEMKLEERVAAVTVPTLLVYGHGDWIVPHAQGARLAERLPRGTGSLVSLTGASHYALPFHPRTVAAVVEWIARHPTAAEAA